MKNFTRLLIFLLAPATRVGAEPYGLVDHFAAGFREVSEPTSLVILGAGIAHLEALVAEVTTVALLKHTIRRERPDGSDRLSFPSGHSDASMTTAASLMEFYGPAVGWPAVGLSAVSMVSRLASRKHAVSDTIFGATIGVLISQRF